MLSHKKRLISYKVLLSKEIWRFFKVYHQTIISPIISALLFFSIFTIAIGKHVDFIGSIKFEVFMSAGLIAMSIIQNAFANTSSVMVISKVNGAIIDYLLPPFTPTQMITCFAISSLIRSTIIAFILYIILFFITGIPIYNPGTLLAFIALSSILLSNIGLLTGIASKRFDDLAAITNYIVTPLSFLSGTFYPISNLSPWFNKIIYYNPFFYIVDGIRFSFTNFKECNIVTALASLTILNIFIWAICYFVLKSGWKLRK
ncbi:MAG: ABC transporter permease [Sphingobacteriia bacterium]|nr:ABC transporter permease [Sphingobacteriia bacterium]